MRPWIGAFVVMIVVALAACSGHGSSAPSPSGSSPSGAVDPRPEVWSTTKQLGVDGAEASNEWVTAAVPPGAVAAGSSATVSVGPPLGVAGGTFARELWGAPVKVDHSEPLGKPVTLKWDVSRLTPQQQTTIVLVRWDDARATWTAAGIPVVVKDGVLTAETMEFSILDWLSNAAADIGQTFGEWVDKRAAAPTCSRDRLPRWMVGVVRPDEDFAAASIRTCVEPDAKSGGVTIRISNNRSYSQRLTLSPDGEKWAWVWNGESDYSPQGTVWNAGHGVLDSKSKVFMPPTKAMAFGLSRPKAPGLVTVKMTARPDAFTMFADLVGLTIDNLSVGGFDSPVLNAFLEAVFECGGKELLKSRPKTAQEGAQLAMFAARDCVSAIVDVGSSELSDVVISRFEKALRSEIAKGGDAASKAIKAGRLVHEVSARLWYLKLFEVVEYVSNQLADSWVGPAEVTIRLRGIPQTLGSWKPTCSDVKKDSNLLYKNLALQDEFTDTSKELWQFPGFAEAAETAVEPLQNCPTTYLVRLASFLPSDWGDPKAAKVAAGAILTALPEATRKSLLSARAPAMCRHRSGRLVNGSLPGQTPTSGFVGIRLRGVEYIDKEIKPARADLTGDGGIDTVAAFLCSAGGVSWPNVIAVYGPGTVLLGSVDLGDYVEAEHSDVTSMKADGNTIRVKWTSYEGCCFDEKDWVGILRYQHSRFVISAVRRR